MTTLDQATEIAICDNPLALEVAIRAAGADKAPRITREDLEAAVSSEFYFRADQAVAAGLNLADAAADMLPASLSLMTFCVLVLRNGFTVTGESACASPENFNAEIGRRIARENAVAKVWPLMGYELKTALAKADTGAEIR